MDCGIGLAGRGQNHAEAVSLDGKGEDGGVALLLWRELRFEFKAVVDVEVADAGFVRDRHLASVCVVLVAIDDGPHGAIRKRPAAGEDTVPMCGIERFPAGADEEGSDTALHGGHTTGGFRITRRDA